MTLRRLLNILLSCFLANDLFDYCAKSQKDGAVYNITKCVWEGGSVFIKIMLLAPPHGETRG